MPRSGKLVIFVILGVGVAAAVFAVWYQQHQSEQSRRFWGTDGAALIARAPHVEALWLELASEKQTACKESLAVPGGTACIRQRRSVEQAPGISNIRHGLTQDVTFQWANEPPDGMSAWEFALRFFDDNRSTVLVFDVSLGQAAEAETSRSVMLDPAAAKELSSFFAEQFGGK